MRWAIAIAISGFAGFVWAGGANPETTVASLDFLLNWGIRSVAIYAACCWTMMWVVASGALS